MKNVFKLSVLLLLFVTGVKMEAAEDVDVRVTEGKVLTVELEDVIKGTVLLIQGKNGEILYKDSLQLNGYYKKAFNLEVIPNGVYYLNLEGENSIRRTEVTKTAEGLKLTGKSSGIIFKPCYKVEESMVKVFLTNPEEKKALFTVFDREGRLVTSMNYNDSVVRKTFDFSGVPAGDYTINVNVGGRTFSKKLKIG